MTGNHLRFRVAPWMPFMALRCDGRDPRTQEVHRMPVPGYTLVWTVTFPNSGPSRRTIFTDPPLQFDQATGFFVFRLGDGELAEILQAREPVAISITVETPAGVEVPWADGCVTGEQLP